MCRPTSALSGCTMFVPNGRTWGCSSHRLIGAMTAAPPLALLASEESLFAGPAGTPPSWSSVAAVFRRRALLSSRPPFALLTSRRLVSGRRPASSCLCRGGFTPPSWSSVAAVFRRRGVSVAPGLRQRCHPACPERSRRERSEDRCPIAPTYRGDESLFLISPR